MTTAAQQTLQNRIKQINREICRVDACQIKVLLKEKAMIEKKLGYTLDPIWR
jgi:hypothetical protein